MNFFSLLKGVKAAIMPTELTVGLGGKGHLSGRLSEDLDNTDIPWAVSVLRVVQEGVVEFALLCRDWQIIRKTLCNVKINPCMHSSFNMQFIT